MEVRGWRGGRGRGGDGWVDEEVDVEYVLLHGDEVDVIRGSEMSGSAVIDGGGGGQVPVECEDRGGGGRHGREGNRHSHGNHRLTPPLTPLPFSSALSLLADCRWV